MPISSETAALLAETAELEMAVGDRRVGDGIRELLAIAAVGRPAVGDDAPLVGEFAICGALPPFLMESLLRFAVDYSSRHLPDARIGVPLLLSRWKLFQFADCEAKLHVFHRSDDDRATHDHPWDSLSITLRSGAVDVAEGGRRTVMEPGMIIYRSAVYAHWIEVDEVGAQPPPMTLFITGPKVREWGFLCPKGWRHWRAFTASTPGSASGAVGVGCDDVAELPFG